MMRPRPSPARIAAGALAALAAAVALAAAGCGGDSNDTTATPTTSAAQGGGGSSTVDLKATDFKFAPSDPTAKAGQVTFNVSNDGQTVHNLEVEGPNGEQELSSDLSPGQSGTLTVDMSKPGKYEFYCPVDDHKQMGMEGEITVN
jgi:uncharacterized cupredoxin-like copper-binding protein